MDATEQKIADFIKSNFDEQEDCLGTLYYGVYTDSRLFNGAVQDCGALTDVLCFEHVETEDGRKFLQVFLSAPPDDMFQDWRSLGELSERDKANVIRLFEEMMKRVLGE